MKAESVVDHLMTVSERFQIGQLGLVLAPDFTVPEGRWSDQTHTVTVKNPAGDQFNTEAIFGLTHFNIRDPKVPIDKRWRVTVTLPHTLKDQIPIGTIIFADAQLVAVLNNNKKKHNKSEMATPRKPSDLFGS